MQRSNPRVQYLREVLGVDSILWKSDVGSIQQKPFEIFDPNPQGIVMQFQTFNEGPFLFLTGSEGKQKLTTEEFQLLEKIIIALKIPFQKTSIAILGEPTSQITQSALSKATQGFSFVFLMGHFLSEILNLSFGEERVLGDQVFYSTLDLENLISNPENKKMAWNQYKQIIPKLQKYMES